MAEFKVGDQALYLGHPLCPRMSPYTGQAVAIIDPLAVHEDWTARTDFHPDRARYGVRCSDGTEWWVLPECLQKIPPKHQPDDLRVAEPLFIQHQLPRLLGRKEKVSELEKQ